MALPESAGQDDSRAKSSRTNHRFLLHLNLHPFEGCTLMEFILTILGDAAA